MTILLNTVKISRPKAKAYLVGAAELMNLSGATSRHFVFGASPVETDCIAINNDWNVVAGDLAEEMSTWQKSL